MSKKDLKAIAGGVGTLILCACLALFLISALGCSAIN